MIFQKQKRIPIQKKDHKSTICNNFFRKNACSNLESKKRIQNTVGIRSLILLIMYCHPQAGKETGNLPEGDYYL